MASGGRARAGCGEGHTHPEGGVLEEDAVGGEHDQVRVGARLHVLHADSHAPRCSHAKHTPHEMQTRGPRNYRKRLRVKGPQQHETDSHSAR